MFEIVGKTNIPFIQLRRYAFVFSAVLLLLGIFAIVQLVRGHVNLGIDFAGGTSVQLKFEKPVQLGEIRQALETDGFRDTELQQFTEGNRVLIQMKKASAARAADSIVNTLAKAFSGNKFVVESSTEIGPKVSKNLQNDTLIAVAVSVLGMILYLAWRFEFTFGVAAAIATFHDVLAVLGIFLILGKEVNLLLVTALLTLAGYSLSDTVVVYDRIRENLRLRPKDDLAALINSSTNEVLGRTLVTSTGVLLVLVALLFFGGEVVHDFSFALLIGVITGTYSSIFIASAIVYEWRKGKKIRPMRAKR